MDECLESIHLNQNGDVLVCSSYLTYQNWSGFVAYLSQNELEKILSDKQKPLMLSSVKTGKSFESSVKEAKWASNEIFLTGNDNGEVGLFKLLNKADQAFENVWTRREHDGIVLSLATQLESNNAVSGCEDGKIKIWDLQSELSIRTYKGHKHAVVAMVYSPNNPNSFISCSEQRSFKDKNVLIWDTRKEKPATLIQNKLGGYASTCDWSTFDTNLVCLGSEFGELVTLDLRNLAYQEAARTHSKPEKVYKRLVRKVEFSTKQKDLIASGSEDCLTKVHRKSGETLEEIFSNNEHQDYVTSLAWNNKKDDQLLTISWDGFIKSHSIKTN